MIKGKSPYPFQTIALAVSFSPGLPVLIAELKRLCELHNAMAVLIHVGKKTGDKHRELSFLLTEIGFHDGNSRIYWEIGDVVSTVLRICKNEVADLLLAGASDKENFSLPVGQTVSEITRKAKCSILVFSGKSSNGYKVISVNGIENEKNDLTFLTALYFAEKENATELNVIEEGEESAYNEDSTRPMISKSSYLFREAIEKTNIHLNYFNLSKDNDSTLSEYAFKSNSDLLITYSGDHKLLIFDRISSSSGIDSLLKNLPCNLLVVHSRLPE